MQKKQNRKQRKKQPKVERLTPEQVSQIIDTLESAKIDDEITDLVRGLIHGNEWFCDQLEKGLLTIAKLRKLFDIQGTEKANRNPRPIFF